MTCNRILRQKPYAVVLRTCADCGLGPCHENKQADTGAGTEMPRYRSHKTVCALEIESISDNVLTFLDRGFAPIAAERELWARYMPVPGDFYVVYADGYKSFSPRKAFLEGYTRA